MKNSFHLQSGHTALLISMPHVGTSIPENLKPGMREVGLQMPDTDWHLPTLYDMAKELGVSVLAAEYSRYVIDLNRSPHDSNLYPGLNTTSLCPVDTFAEELIYREGMAPGPEEIQNRIINYWQPYQLQLQIELDRLRNMHGIAVLWDAHSIASQVPRFFKGKLPDFNFGTADGKSCDPSLQQALSDTMRDAAKTSGYTHVFNGRFKGGFITRNYGQPAMGIHAVQLEMSQSIYMNEHPPFDYQPALAKNVQPLLRALLTTCLSWAQARHLEQNAS
jgi:N-formylglutamate deformylase